MYHHLGLNTIFVFEAISIYSVHISNFLFTSKLFTPYKPYVSSANSNMTAVYRKSYVGIHPNTFEIHKSIPKIGPIWASGILAGCVGLIWLKNASGNFVFEDHRVSKADNPFLRYYIGEAVNRIRQHIPEYRDLYSEKYAEVTKHQQKRALALTSRKFARPVFGLRAKTNGAPVKYGTPN